MANVNVDLTLDDAVAEVLGMLTGLDLTYEPQYDRYRAITRALNRALRTNALENDWSYYSSVETIGTAHAGDTQVALRATLRPRIINDDAVRLVDDTGRTRVWAYFLPREALHKYVGRGGLWAAHTRATIDFSRPLLRVEDGLSIEVPVMREPRMFRLPEDSADTVPDDVRQQNVDFDFPDIIIARAAYYVAQSDPVMQPRAQTLEQEYKQLGYALVERDQRNTDSPFLNDFFVPVSSSIDGPTHALSHRHPHADERAW